MQAGVEGADEKNPIAEMQVAYGFALETAYAEFIVIWGDYSGAHVKMCQSRICSYEILCRTYLLYASYIVPVNGMRYNRPKRKDIIRT